MVKSIKTYYVDQNGYLVKVVRTDRLDDGGWLIRHDLAERLKSERGNND